MTPENLSRVVDGMIFQNPILYGGGTLKTLEDAKEASRSAAGGFEMGTYTFKPWAGNSGTTYSEEYLVTETYEGEEIRVLYATRNVLGLPNPGFQYVLANGREMVKLAHHEGKVVGVSISSNSIDELLIMIRDAFSLDFDFVVINGSCPNKVGDDPATLLPMVGFDQFWMEEFLRQLNAVYRQRMNIYFKRAPSPPHLLQQSTLLLGSCPVIAGVVDTNTIPSTFTYDAHGKQTTDPAGGLAGMGGPVLKPLVLGHLIQTGKLIPQLGRPFTRFGIGGAFRGKDVLDMFRAGADIVQVSSRFWHEGRNHRVFGTILEEFVEALEKCPLPVL